jgi:L-alanine-DL-glutamate epimerase-like enolase superfamily enzyme
MQAGARSAATPGIVRIAGIDCVAGRVPIAVPVATSFGMMRDRPAVFVRVRDDSGAEGFGEIWCNFPSGGADYRKSLVDDVVGPALLARPVAVATVFDDLMLRHRVLALQCGDFGAFGQVCAGIDIACHDLAARVAGVPLYGMLNPDAAGRVPVYASGIHPNDAEATIGTARAAGHRRFKVKVGFGRDTDLRALDAVRRLLRPGERLMVDANQAWSEQQAERAVQDYAGLELAWIEEPLRADSGIEAWRKLAANAPAPLAAGENMRSREEFDAALAAGALRFFQPDVAKWGGISGCRYVGAAALAAGAAYCPHYLGGGIGLLASAHLLAAVGGPGWLEMDVNPNPWRDDLLPAGFRVEDGAVALGDTPGLGVSPRHLFA